jgi:NADH-quinone oxidoreductase subunit E
MTQAPGSARAGDKTDGAGRVDGSGRPPREFSPAARKRIAWLFSRYPVKVAALLPILRLAEEEFGAIDQAAMACVARTVGVSPGYVYGVVTFYTQYRREGDGRHVIQVCSTLSCALRGCRGLVRHIEERLGISPGQTTPDGRFTLKKVECLGSCDTAPVMQVNEKYHESLTLEKLDAVIDALE